MEEKKVKMRRKQMQVRSVYVEPWERPNMYMLKRYWYTENEFKSKYFLQFVSEQYKAKEAKVFHFNAWTTSVIDLFEFLVSYINNNPGSFKHNIPEDIFVKPKKKPKRKWFEQIQVDLDDISPVCFDS